MIQIPEAKMQEILSIQKQIEQLEKKLKLVRGPEFDIAEMQDTLDCLKDDLLYFKTKDRELKQELADNQKEITRTEKDIERVKKKVAKLKFLK